MPAYYSTAHGYYLSYSYYSDGIYSHHESRYYGPNYYESNFYKHNQYEVLTRYESGYGGYHYRSSYSPAYGHTFSYVNYNAVFEIYSQTYGHDNYRVSTEYQPLSNIYGRYSIYTNKTYGVEYENSRVYQGGAYPEYYHYSGPVHFEQTAYYGPYNSYS